MDTFITKERAVNFTTDEKSRFQSLIEKYKEILFCKKTDNVSNLKKNKTWSEIHAQFNAGGDQPRTLRQLKAKLDNMKRNARKDASQERQSRLRTGGGPPEPPVQPETEWFRSVMPISMDGLPSVVDDDVIQGQSTFEIMNDSQSQEIITLNEVLPASDVQDKNIIPNEMIMNMSETKTNMDNVFDSKTPSSLLRTPISKPLRTRRMPIKSKNLPKFKDQVLCKIREQEEETHKLRRLHMEQKRKEENELYEIQKEIFEIQKQKALLELNILQNKFNK